MKNIITSKERDLGGFSVRRLLPHVTQPMVGPFIFFDHIGPAHFQAGQGIDVRPHPHINLVTVTYLFEGKLQHRDNLGSEQLIEPGAINWMVAGQGIVHSERTPADLRKSGGSLNGIQCWLALPKETEDRAPYFTHYPATSLPEFKITQIELKLLLGTAFGHQSPVSIHSDLFYLEVKLPKSSTLRLPKDHRETAVYVVNGNIQVHGQAIPRYYMAINDNKQDCIIEAIDDAHLMLLGGTSLGKRYIYWNFVSSSKNKIEEAKQEWHKGPGATGSRFSKIPSDDKEFIPLPVEDKKKIPKGTIM